MAQLVRALAGAARILEPLEGRAIVPEELRPLVTKLYPGVAHMLGFLERAGEDNLNTALQCHCEEAAMCPHPICPRECSWYPYQISLASARSDSFQFSD